MSAKRTVTTLSSREFNQDTGRAKKAAKHGPVFITDRGKPSHVLLTVEHYQKLLAPPSTIIDVLAMPGAENIDFDPAPARGLFRPADQKG
jgi:prevent-host-death family protein